MVNIPEPSCLDAALERKALDEGFLFTPVYKENRLYLQWLRYGKPKDFPFQEPIHKQVIQDIESRAKVGHKKYGKYITPHDGDNYLQHLYEELLDAAHYIKAAIEERKQCE